MRRCPSCALPLTLAGVSPKGENVYACTATRYVYDKAKTHSFPCVPDGRFFVGDNLSRTFPEHVAFAKREGKGGNVLLPHTEDAAFAQQDPSVGFARMLAEKFATLDDLPHAVGKPVPAYIRAKGLRTILARLRPAVIYAGQAWRRAPRVAA